jgi:hypothetical protein
MFDQHGDVPTDDLHGTASLAFNPRGSNRPGRPVGFFEIVVRTDAAEHCWPSWAEGSGLTGGGGFGGLIPMGYAKDFRYRRQRPDEFGRTLWFFAFSVPTSIRIRNGRAEDSASSVTIRVADLASAPNALVGQLTDLGVRVLRLDPPQQTAKR